MLSGSSSFRQPRHPSLDNLPRAQHKSRSHPQLSSTGWNPDDEREESFWESLMDLVTAVVSVWCIAGLLLLLVVLYMTVRPFSLSFYRRLASTLGGASFLDAMTLLLPNMRLCLTGDSDIPSPVGTSVMVCNHAFDCDWWAVLMLGRCVGLRGSVKVFLRNECLQVEPQKRNSLALSLRSDSSSSQLGSKKATVTATKTVTFTRQTNGHGSSSTTKNGNTSSHDRKVSLFVSLAAQMVHSLLDFPVLSNENNYIEDREDMFSLLKSFSETRGTPVHLLLFPEAWSLHGTKNRKAVLAKSNEFAKREGRPQLTHLLLPRTTGFNASIDSLRESSPVVYDVTIAYRGYDGSSRSAMDISFPAMWRILRQPNQEIHLRVKRYSMEEVLQDASWLDKKWAEKDRLLSQFSRNQEFPIDRRGFWKHRVFDTREFAVENSILSLLRLLIIPFFVPLLLLLSIPIFWIVLWSWIIYKTYQILFHSEGARRASSLEESGARTVQTPGSAGLDSAAGTPFFPATPFGSPSTSNWRDMIGNPFDFS